MVLAQDEARALKHNYIGTEHILLGLLREEEGLATRVLDSLGIAVDEVRPLVARIVGLGDEAATGQIPFTPRAKKVLELALREALSLGHDYVGTEHLLLGLARENEGVAARVLLDFGVDADLIREATLDLLSGPPTTAGKWRRRQEEREAEAAVANPELASRLARTRDEKERALDEGDFDRAARARQAEASLRRSLLGIPDPPAVQAQRRVGSVEARTVMSVRASATRESASVALFVAGAVIFLVALTIGMLIGYLIWH